MIGIILTVIGVIITLAGALLKIEIPIGGFITLSVFGLGAFLTIMGLTTFARAIDDVLGPFWYGGLMFFLGLGMGWAFLKFLGFDLFGTILGMVKTQLPTNATKWGP